MAMSPLSRNTWARPPAVQSLLAAPEGEGGSNHPGGVPASHPQEDLSGLAGRAGREADRVVRVVPALVPQELRDLEHADQLVLAAGAVGPMQRDSAAPRPARLASRESRHGALV